MVLSFLLPILPRESELVSRSLGASPQNAVYQCVATGWRKWEGHPLCLRGQLHLVGPPQPLFPQFLTGWAAFRRALFFRSKRSRFSQFYFFSVVGSWAVSGTAPSEGTVCWTTSAGLQVPGQKAVLLLQAVVTLTLGGGNAGPSLA